MRRSTHDAVIRTSRSCGWSYEEVNTVAQCPTCATNWAQGNIARSPWRQGLAGHGIHSTKLGSAYNLRPECDASNYPAEFDASADDTEAWRRPSDDPVGRSDYDALLDESGVMNAIMKIASDAMREYLDVIYDQDSATVDAYVTATDRGTRHFSHMPRDIAAYIFRELKHGPTVDSAFFEAQLLIKYQGLQSREIPSWILEQVWDYPETTYAAEALIAGGYLTEVQLAEAATANTSEEAIAVVQGAMAGAGHPPELIRSVGIYAAALSLLIRSIEPARRLAAGPLYAIIHTLWRCGVAGVTAQEVLHHHGAYSVMSHKGAAGKSKGYDDARDYRKEKGKNILKKLLAVVGGAYPHDRCPDYDLHELVMSLQLYLEAYENSANRAQFRDQGQPRSANQARNMAFYNVVSAADVVSHLGSHTRRQTLRYWQRNEGTGLDANVEEAAEELKGLFIGLLIAENERWV